MHQGQADHHGGVQRHSRVPHGAERFQRPIQQRLLQKQVAAGIAGQAKLRKHDQARALIRGLFRQPDDFGSVIGAVRDP